MTYKPEIDGLRAVGVLLVLLCHMQLGMTGGYVGVDVFFVISGFLITFIILNGIEQGKFGFWNFYGRRFVRLYPALIVVMIITLVAGFLLASPTYYELMGRSGKYAITSTTNIYFNKHLGYFDGSAQGQPFLHTWSLGVEWQFYLIWPFIVWATMKVSRKLLVAVLALITVASIFASQWALTHDTNGAYYLMHYRAFELSIGALLVFIYHKKPKPALGAVMMLTGVLTILVCAFFYTPKTPFPGYAALLPTLATAACIYGGQSFTKGNFLRFKPVVYIGNISYSVYLYHWPLLLLYGYYVFRDLHLSERLILLVISLVLGAISYEWIEKRINWRSLSRKRLACFVMVIITGLIAGVCQYISTGGKNIDAGDHSLSRGAQGLAWRMSGNELLNPDYNIWGGKNYGEKLNLIGAQDQTPFAIFAGDSLVGNLAIGLDEAARKQDASISIIFTLACIISEIDQRSQATPLCRALSTQALDTAHEKQLPLVLSQAWWAASNAPVPNADGTLNQERTSDYSTGELDFIFANLDHIRSRVPKQPIILIGGVPFQNTKGAPRECFLRPCYLPSVCEREVKDYAVQDSASYDINQALKAYAQEHENMYYIDLAPVLCPGGVCPAKLHAQTYVDPIHLSVYGSRTVAPYILQEVHRILNFESKTNLKSITTALIDENKPITLQKPIFRETR